MPLTISIVNMIIANNETWQYTFQFGTLGDTSWSFDHCELFTDVKTEASDDTPLLSVNSLESAGGILILDSVQRIAQYLVAPEIIQAQLPVGNYVYDLLMVNQTTFVSQRLMTGTLQVIDGPTKEQ